MAKLEHDWITLYIAEEMWAVLLAYVQVNLYLSSRYHNIWPRVIRES